MRSLAAGGAAAFLLVAGCGGDDDRDAAPAATTTASASTLYELAPTRRCLEARGAVVRRLDAGEGRLRTLRDLAQRTSYEVRLDGARIGLALTRRAADARLLVMLLRIPGDAYRLERRRNAVLMYLSADRLRGATVRDCLTFSS